MLMFVQGTCRILLNIDNVGREPFERVIVSATKLKGFRTTFKSFWCRLNISEKEKLVESPLFSVYFAYHLNYLHTCNSTKICAGDKNCKRESVAATREEKTDGKKILKQKKTQDDKKHESGREDAHKKKKHPRCNATLKKFGVKN